MPIENRLRLIPTSRIHIRPDRQRKTVDEAYIETLRESIYGPAGLLHPIIIEPNPLIPDSFFLVAGECRLRAWKLLEALPKDAWIHPKGIPARLITELSLREREQIELEENIKRRDLNWRDSSLAYVRIYELVGAELREEEQEEERELEDGDTSPDTSPSFSYVAGRIGVTESWCHTMVTVGRAVFIEDKEVLNCESARAAKALLDRRIKRTVSIEMAKFGEIEVENPEESTPASLDVDLDLDLDDEVPTIFPVRYHVWKDDFTGGDFSELANYEKINFLHCDVPYGKSLHTSDLYKTKAKDMDFEDTEEIYWKCCQAVIKLKTEGFLSQSCHIMFWFPMSAYIATVELFQNAGFKVDPYPLFWMKSDKMGIIPDPQRGPRRIYETALLMTLGDRFTVRSTVNASYASSEKRSEAQHVSYKPREALKDFFRMIVDEDTVFYDPTCGSGTALAEALSQGAKLILGSDINPECVEHSTDRAEEAHNVLIRN